MPSQTVTLSSVGTSNPVHCNWRGGSPITAGITMGSTTMTSDFILQYTLFDTMLSTNAVGTASSNAAWLGLSSAIGSSATHFTAANGDNGVMFNILTPVAGLRISSTAISSSSLTLRVIQGE